MEETKAIQSIIKAFEKKDSFKLRELSKELIRKSAVFSSELFAELSVLAYSLHKLFSKAHFSEQKTWKNFVNNTREQLLELEKTIETRQKALERIEKILFAIEQFDKEHGNYSQSIVEKARIRQASFLYGLGMSLSKAAELCKTQTKSLQSYIGYTKIHEEHEDEISIKKRTKTLKTILK